MSTKYFTNLSSEILLLRAKIELSTVSMVW